jgi:hypothetical protein
MGTRPESRSGNTNFREALIDKLKREPDDGSLFFKEDGSIPEKSDQNGSPGSLILMLSIFAFAPETWLTKVKKSESGRI